MIKLPFSKLSDSVEVDGKEYKINTDFRIWIMIYCVLNDSDITVSDKLINFFMFAFCDRVPENTRLAIEKLLSFMSADNKKQRKENTQKTIDFVADEKYIYSAFLQQYGIDLYETNMHWWKFLALFNGLGDDTEMMKIINYRCADISSIKNKEYKKFISKMKNYYRIDGEVSEDSISSALM